MLSIALLLGCSSLPNTLARPNQVEVGADGVVYVSDFHHQRIVVLEPDGTFRETWAQRGIGEGRLWQVWSMALDRDGSLLILDQEPVEHPDRNTQIVMKRFARGQHTESVVLHDLNGEPFSIAEGVTAHPAGGYVVAETGSGQLIRYDAQWRPVERFAPYDGQGESSTGVVAAHDELWVLEQYRARVRRVATDGQQIAVFEREGRGPTRASFPKNLDHCGDSVALADLGNHRVQVYGTDGRHRRAIELEPRSADRPVQVMDVAFTDGCESLWVVDGKGERVLRVALDGSIEASVSSW